jgi:hypothetical protein
MAASTIAVARTLPRAGSRAAPRVWVPGVDTPRQLRMLEPLREREQAEQRRAVQQATAPEGVVPARPSWVERLGAWLSRRGDAAMQRHVKAWTLPR